MKLFYRSIGEGPPLIILHGLFGMSDNWMTPAKKVSEKFSVILPDLRNHGQSPFSDDWNFNVMSEDVLELMNDLKLERTNIVGHSLGGKIAMTLALNHPERIQKLIIADIAPRKYPPSASHQLIIQTLSGINLKEISSRKEVENKLISSGIETAAAQLLLKNLYWKDTQLSWRFNLKVIADNIESFADSSAVQNKIFSGETLFVRGSNSNYILETDIPEIKKIFPAAIISTIEGAGHWLHADKPREFVELISEFLK